MVRRHIQSTLLLSAALCAAANSVMAQPDCEQPVGRFGSIQGSVDIQHNQAASWRIATLDVRLCEGDTIRVGEQSRAAVYLSNETVLRMDQNTTMRLVDVADDEQERSWLDLIKGAIQTFSRQPRRLSINSPYLNGSVEGTEFVVWVDEASGSILVLEGKVMASNDQGSVKVGPGEVAEAQAGQAPVLRTWVLPRDAVQWSLFYPPILAAGGDPVPQNPGDVAYHIHRAASLMDVGRVDQARAEIDLALQQDPHAGLAYALRAVLNVVHNQRQQALADAEQAVALSDSAAAKIALSYAQQASFRIEPARATLLLAVKEHPDNALAWARLGELWLMSGKTDRANEAAARAAALAPDLARAHLVSGFAALAEFRHTAARSAFERAIRLSSADPLAHLGLGLAEISGGSLEKGRAQLEIAAGLDSNVSLLRAYLGKAYFEEKRVPLAARQYSIAKSLDPLDPTAYLYDGILKQTVNRPVEAVQDLEKSIELNENRAVYRSRLLLDKDRAARGTSLARAYKDLGFSQLGINQASASLSLDPANASAHRFLSDSYRDVRRREIARVSELLQAQLMQDVNINPVQSSVSQTNLNIVTAGGPANPGFSEFTPLFQKNQAQVNVTAFGGNNSTHGAEGVATAQYDRYSVSVGGLKYDTDGWRPNNELDQTAVTGLVQMAVTERINLQAEFQYRDSEEGDLAFNFDPDDFLKNKTIKRDQTTGRLGLRYSPSSDSHFLLSYIHSKRDEKNKQSEELPPILFLPPRARTDRKFRDEGDQLEVHHIREIEDLNLIVGAGYNNVDNRDDLSLSIDDPVIGNLLSVSDTEKTQVRQPHGYLYANAKPARALTVTLGASYDHYEEGDLDSNSFNPKLGAQWDVSDRVSLRAAVFKTVKPALVNNRTIEPTQVAGFNQFFDDVNGTKSWRYAAGLDWRMTADLAAGSEFSYREMDEPLFTDDGGDRFESRDEQFHKLYLYWTPSERVAVNSQLSYDRYTSENGIATEFDNLPKKVRTVSLPVGITYFSKSGWFSGITGSFVDQDVKRSGTATQADGDDSFTVVDGVIGYRFGKRLGVASLGVSNIFDKDFKYQDDSYREFRDEPSIGPYFPDRTVMGRLTLNY
jgi:tetratricopeptide (TPR) repeat protein/opacity protein-like surface antigen